MNLDDLMRVFDKAYCLNLDNQDTKISSDRAGVRAVVEAMRFWCVDKSVRYNFGAQEFDDAFNEILGSDAGSEKAVGASARKDEEQDNGCITPASPKPAADPKDGSMTALVEKVARAIVINLGGDPDDAACGGTKAQWELHTSTARATIRATLQHFSEPGNVTEGMALELFMLFPDTVFGSDCNKAIVAAMRAALEEVK